MKILEDLWYGNICPIEQPGYRHEDSKTLLELFNRNGAKLESTLNEDEKETLEKMRESWLEMQQYAEWDAICQGCFSIFYTLHNILEPWTCKTPMAFTIRSPWYV